MVAGHLSLDESDVDLGCALGHGVQLGQLPLHAFEKTDLEADEVVVDAHPVARVFPVLGLDVLALEWPTSWRFSFTCHHSLAIAYSPGWPME